MTREARACVRPGAAEPLPGLPARSAWQLWRELAMEDPAMATKEEDRARMIERHKLVVSLIEVNSQQMRCQNARAGLEIERACAARDAALPDASSDLAALIASLDERMAGLAGEMQRLAAQRDFLNGGLAEFDAPPAPAQGKRAPGEQ